MPHEPQRNNVQKWERAKLRQDGAADRQRKGGMRDEAAGVAVRSDTLKTLGADRGPEQECIDAGQEAGQSETVKQADATGGAKKAQQGEMPKHACVGNRPIPEEKAKMGRWAKGRKKPEGRREAEQRQKT